MRIVLRYNPLAGRGRADAIADAAASRLERDGHEVRRAPVSKTDPGSLARALDGAANGGGPADLLAVIGGDGTIHHALPDVLARGTPIYHVPLGTENLFARQFGMDADVERLAAAVRRAEVTRVDVGVCNGVPFVLMCSMGPDANVVHRLAKVRRGRITHFSYLAPGIAEFFRPGIPRLRIEVDGRTVVDGRRGLVVIANSRQYAMRVDPAARASMTDGLLDAVFFPCSTSLGVLAWAMWARQGRHLSSRALVYATGTRVKAESLEPGGSLHQIDGEPGSGASAGESDRVPALDCEVRPGALRVLIPPPEPQT